MNEFCGNCLELCAEETPDGTRRRLLCMSTRAFNAFRDDQKAVFAQHIDEIVHSPIDMIETIGGGGVRCMLAELF